MRAFAISPDGTRIAYEARGTSAPELVFVHGWSCNRGYWDAQLVALSASALVVAVDLAGHGESGAARQDWSIAAFGADVASVVDDLALEEVILVGHSMGADVTLEASRHLRDRVCGLVWVDQHRQLSQFMSEVEVRERIASFRTDFATATHAFVRGLFSPSADPSLVERVAREMSSAPQQVALCALEATWNYAREVPAILSQLKLPVVAINSQGDSTGIESMRRHGVDVVSMPGAGHFPMMERPNEFNSCLVQIVEVLTRKCEGDA